MNQNSEGGSIMRTEFESALVEDRLASPTSLPSEMASADRTPVALLDVVRYCYPLVTFGTLPQQFRMCVNVDIGETSPPMALGQLLH